MADTITKTTTKSYGSRLKSAIGGIGFGLLLFLGSFYLLFWNEGRADMSKVAEQAVEIDAATVLSEHEGTFVAARGKVGVQGEIGDSFVAPGNYLALQRNVEMYAWKENSSSKSEKKLGGSEETTTTYSYTKEWTRSPANSSNFEKSEGHFNPSMMYEGETIYAAAANVGAYAITPSKISFGGFTNLNITEDQFLPGVSSGTGGTMSGTVMSGTTMSGSTMMPMLSNGTIFIGSGNNTSPEVGDVKVTYKVVTPGKTMTALGMTSGSSLVPYVEQGKGQLYELADGTLSEIVSAKAGEHSTMGWVWRVVGFFMMWIGLSSILAPLSVLLDILPLLGDVSQGIIGFVTFIIALVLSVVTILLSMVLHNIWAVIIVAIIILIGAYLIISKKLQKKAA